jgi:hypothetical protein
MKFSKMYFLDERRFDMRKEDRGKRMDAGFSLYPRDNKRFLSIREAIEERTGRPCSASTAIVYLLDCYDDLQKVDAIVKSQLPTRKGK